MKAFRSLFVFLLVLLGGFTLPQPLNVEATTKDYAYSVLSSYVSASDTTWSLVDASRFPDPALVGQYWVRTWDAIYGGPASDPQTEEVRVTAKSGNDLTVVRGGASGDTAYAHNTAGRTYRVMIALGTREVNRVFRLLNVADSFGATGDDSTDDTQAIQTAIGAARAGDEIVFPAGTYKITSALTVTTDGVTLRGLGQATIHQATASEFGIDVNASEVTIEGLRLVGTSPTSLDNDYAIDVRASSYASAYTGFALRNCFIQGWNRALTLIYSTDFLVTGNRIDDVVYAGVYCGSCTRGRIADNVITDINDELVATGNGYGITCTRNAIDSLITDPRCEWITITGNVVENSPVYKGIDTHGGAHITISDNVVRKCQIGIAVVGARNTASDVVYAPLDIAITGNVLDSENTDGDGTYNLVGINCQGGPDGPELLSGLSITGNRVKNYGNAEGTASWSSGSGIALVLTAGACVSGNSLEDCGPIGINVREENYGFSVTGNSLVDCWGSAATNGFGIQFGQSNHTGVIEGNSFIKDDKVATGVGVTAFRWDATFAGTNEITIGKNYSEYTDYFAGNNPAIARPQDGDYYAKNWSVVADGTTDDSTALQAVVDAAAAAGGGIVHLPAGTILVGSAITIADGVTLQGQGATATNLAGDTISTLLSASSASANISDIGVRDLLLSGFTTNGVNLSASSNAIQNVQIINCHFSASATNGINIGANDISNVLAIGCQFTSITNDFVDASDHPETNLMLSEGVLTIGSDANLYRSSADTLATDDALDVAGELNAQAQLVTSSGVRRLTTEVNSNTTLDGTYYIVVADCSGGDVSLTLPASPAAGQSFVLIKFSASNTLTIARNGQNIDDAASDIALTGNLSRRALVWHDRSGTDTWYVTEQQGS